MPGDEPAPQTTTQNIALTDASGALNTRDFPGSLKANEFSQLENIYTDEGGYPGKKVGGGAVIQYAPINPTPFVADANTLALWHLTEAGQPYADSSGNGRSLTTFFPNQSIQQVSGIFTTGQKMTLPTILGNVISGGGAFLNSAGFIGDSPFDKLAAISFEGWINIDPNFTGQTYSYEGKIYPDLSQSGGAIVGTFDQSFSFVNGITLNRDWDASNNINKSAPYFEFTINTNGSAGAKTVLKGNELATGTWLFVQGIYDSTTGLASLIVNGSIQAQAFVNGGGTVNDATGKTVVVGGHYSSDAENFFFLALPGIFDEVRISNSSRLGQVPFEAPHGSIFEFFLSNGTDQLVVDAGDSIFYTVGDGNWQQFTDGYGKALTGRSTTQRNCFLQMGDILYFCNGVDPMLAWDGTRFVPWFEPTTELQLDPLGAGAGPLAGTYDYVYTAVYGTEQTGPSPLQQIVLSNTGNIIIQQIMTRHANCSALNIWRTKSGSPGVYYLVRTIPNNSNVQSLNMAGAYVAGSTASPTTDSGSDGVDDSALGTGDYILMPAEVQTTQGQNPQYLIDNYDRIFMAGMNNAPYEMDFTEPGLPDVRLAANFVTDHGNRKITGLSKLVGEVDAHKDGRGCVVLRGSDPSNWTQFENLHETLGATNHWGIVYRSIPREGGAGDDRTEVCIPTPEGWYGYVGYDFYRIDDIINGTFATLAQNNAIRQDFNTSTEAEFQSAANNGGSATVNIQAQVYSTDGLREVPGEVQIVNQLDYIGLWLGGAGAPNGNVIAMCAGQNVDEYWFSTDGDNNLWHTTNNFLTVSIATSLNDKLERIIEITKQGANDFYYLITDHNSNEVIRATVAGNTTIVGTGQPIEIPVSTTQGFYPGQFLDLTSPGHVLPALVASIQVPPMLQTYVPTNFELYNATAPLFQQPINPLNPNNNNPISPGFLTLVLAIGVELPVGTEIYQSSTMTPDSYGGELYTWNNGTQVLSGALAGTKLYHSSDIPFSVNSSDQGSGNPSQNVEVQIGGFQVFGNPQEWLGIGPNFGDTPTPFYVNHRQSLNVLPGENSFNVGSNLYPFGIAIFNLPDQITAPPTDFDLQLIGISSNDLAVSFGFPAGPIPNNFVGGLPMYANQFSSDEPSAILPDFMPGLYSFSAPLKAAIIDPTGHQFGWQGVQPQVFATRREFPAWLGGTMRPQSFYDGDTGNIFFLASAAENASGNHTAYLNGWNNSGLTAYNTIPVTAITPDGNGNAYYASPTDANNKPSFVLYKDSLSLFTVHLASQSITEFSAVTRLFYEAASSRLMWFEKSFGSNQFANYSGNIFAISNKLAGTPYVDLLSLPQTNNESPSNGTGGGPVLQEAVRQTDAPDVWIVAVNKIAGEAFYSVADTLLNPFGATNSDVGVIISGPYIDPNTGDTATGVSSNLIFVPSSGSTGNTPLWADRIYFGAQNVGVPVQLGLPGNWTVVGTFASAVAALGGITAFDTFTAQYQSNGGTILFEMANGAAVGNPPGPPIFTPGQFVVVKPNNPVQLGVGNLGVYVQWEATLTWTFALNDETISPVIDYVDISYFVGSAPTPPVVGIHLKGRSRWSVALAGQSAPGLEIVYQKTNTWTTCSGRSIIGYALFRGNLVCFEGYTLLQMETGPTWNGAVIPIKAVTGYLMNEPCDKYIRNIKVNLQQWQNQDYPDVGAWLEIQPLQAGMVPVGSAWFAPIPVTQTTPFPEQVTAIMKKLGQAWVRALAIQISTSSDTGIYAPSPEQVENIQAILLTIRKSPPRYAMPVL